MHGLLASQLRVTILCYPLVCVHCGPVVDFFITKQTYLHPFDFVRNLFHLLVIITSLLDFPITAKAGTQDLKESFYLTVPNTLYEKTGGDDCGDLVIVSILILYLSILYAFTFTCIFTTIAKSTWRSNFGA